MTIDTKRLATDPGYWAECGAPEDATHFSPEKSDFDPCWMKFDGMWRAKYIGSTRDNWGFDDPDDNPERYIPRPQKPEVERVDVVPDVYMCAAGCGCLWSDNGDETMSLYGPRSQSCDVCEMEPLKNMVPVRFERTKLQRQRDDAVREAAHAIEMKNGSPITLYLKYCEDLYDAGFLRAETKDV